MAGISISIQSYSSADSMVLMTQETHGLDMGKVKNMQEREPIL